MPYCFSSDRAPDKNCRVKQVVSDYRWGKYPHKTKIKSEQALENISNRLAAIEGGLQDIRQARHHTGTSPSVTPAPPTPTETGTVAIQTFEGDVSFSAQTLRASAAADSTVRQLHQHDHTSATNIMNTMNSLKHCLNPHKALTVQETRLPRQTSGLIRPDVDLLPAAFVVALLRRIRGGYSSLTKHYTH